MKLIWGYISYETEHHHNYDKLEDGWVKWRIGQKLGWLYKDDFSWYKKEFKDEIKEYEEHNRKDICFELWLRNRQGLPFEGILFTLPDKEFSIENAVLCIYDYPTEKCSPEVDWISFNRFLEQKDLYKVYKI